jgi:hypothetical protein
MGKHQHVIRRDRGWAVRGEGNARDTSVHDTQKQAIAAARSIAKHQQSDLLVHGVDGKIRARYSYSAAGGKKPAADAKPILLAGGNPQIAKADGNAPVQAYIAAMPGWKRDVGRRLDAIIERVVPDVRKAVRWNSPFYGMEGRGWFLNFHCFTKYVKVAFFRGSALSPVPPGESKHKDVRYLDIHEDEQIDDAQLAAWIRQAAALPGWEP